RPLPRPRPARVDRRERPHERGLLPRRLRLRDRRVPRLGGTRRTPPPGASRDHFLPRGARDLPPRGAVGRPAPLHDAPARPRREADSLFPRDVPRDGGLPRGDERAYVAPRERGDAAGESDDPRDPRAPGAHPEGARRAAAAAAGRADDRALVASHDAAVVHLSPLRVNQAGATSTIASNAAWPAENPKTSTASSGIAASPDVRRFRPSQPSRIHTVPRGIFSVTRARARNSPRALWIRIGAPSAIARGAASAGAIQR